MSFDPSGLWPLSHHGYWTLWRYAGPDKLDDMLGTGYFPATSRLKIKDVVYLFGQDRDMAHAVVTGDQPLTVWPISSPVRFWSKRPVAVSTA